MTNSCPSYCEGNICFQDGLECKHTEKTYEKNCDKFSRIILPNIIRAQRRTFTLREELDMEEED